MASTVQVVLQQDLKNVGKSGELVKVRPGYARNYLFPRGLAIAPTDHNAARFAKEKAVHDAELLKREEKARALRDKLADQTLVFVRKAHGDQRLFGSVRPEEIATQIASACGEAIEASRIHMEGNIDTLGPHTVTVSLYKDISVAVRVRVDEEAPQKEE